MKHATIKKTAGKNNRIAVIVSRFNHKITGGLLTGCLAALKEAGVKQSRVTKIEVPGAFELAWAAQETALKKKYSAVICLGAVIRGETDHYQHIAGEAARGIREAGMRTRVPVIFGVLTCATLAQAVARSTGRHNKGYEAGWAAVEMARLTSRQKRQA